MLVIRRPRPLLPIPTLLTTLVVTSALTLTACGSQVPPQDFVGAQGGAGTAAGIAAGGAAGPSGAVVAGGSTGGTVTGGTTGGGGIGTDGGTSRGTGGSGGSSGTGGTGGSAGAPAVAGVKAGSCAGFRNSTGITNSTITLANASDLSGPVPGLFRSAQAAVTAYVAYFNATSSICGRKLALTGLDSGESESGDQQAATTACGNAFALVGSMAAFDAGGASTVAGCGIPDLRAASTETARYRSPVSFGAYSLAVPEIPTVPFSYLKRIGRGAEKSAAFVYLNAGASTLNARSFIAGEQKQGFVFRSKIAIDVTSVPNYNGYATQLKGDGIKYVQYIGAYQYAQKLKSAFEANDYHPIFVMDPTAYDANYVAGGPAMNGTYVFISGPLFEEVGRNPRLGEYLTWLQRTSGGAPSFFGTYAWAAAALFVQKAVELGGKLTRASLIAALRSVHGYTAGAMVPPQDVGGKHSSGCSTVIQLVNGAWVRRTPAPFTCGPTVNSGIGG